MRVESSISIKYLFATKPFMPKELRTEDGRRIKFDVILYKDIKINFKKRGC